MSLYIDNKFIRLLSYRLRNFKQKKDNLYNFSCPICGDSKRNQRKARGFVFQKGNDLFYKCHNCAKSTNLAGLIEHVDPLLYKEYTMERYMDGDTGRRKVKEPTFNIPATRFDKLEKKKVYDFAEWCCDLPVDHISNQYIEDRMIPEKFRKTFFYTRDYKKFVDALYPNHGLIIKSHERLVIPIFDEFNELVAVIGRSLVKSKDIERYIMVEKEGCSAVYGIDRVDKNRDVYVVEGAFDSMFVSNCVATSNSDLRKITEVLKKEQVVLMYDNEPRNEQIVKQIGRSIDLGFRVVIWPDKIQEKDINDMIKTGLTEPEIESIIYNNTFSGIKAKFNFNLWKRV